MIAYIPNLLTVVRLALVPLYIVLIYDGRYSEALLVFVLAGVSDGLDGYIAKRYDCESRLGAMLDPLADKCLLISAYAMLAYIGAVPFWLTVVVIFRDVLIIGGALMVLALHGTPRMIPTFISKLNTVLQILFVLVVMIQLAGLLDTQLVQYPLSLAVLITSVVSGAHYVWTWGFARSEDMLEPPRSN